MSDAAVPTVSVVLPTYNRAALIRRSLGSVLAQDFTDLEVIVVDDGSTDDTLAVIAAIGDPRVRIARTAGREGAPTARNVGMAAARGRFIAFQDSDDYWLPDKLTKQFAALEAEPGADACYCQLLQVYTDFVAIVPDAKVAHRAGDILPSLVRDSFISTQTLLVRSEAVRATPGFDPRLPRLQDWDLVLELAQKHRFAHVPEPLVIAYETPGNLTSFAAKGIAARAAILDKQAALYARFPEAAARHFHIMASLSLKHGDRRAAAGYATRATRLDPGNARYWALRLSAWARRRR